MKTLLVFVVLGALAFAEDHGYTVDCTTVPLSPACHSYNEMVTKKDKDILLSVVMNEAFVCFRDGDDTFITIAFDIPTGSSLTRQSKYTSTGSGSVFYSRYKNGLNEDERIADGKWTASTFRPDGSSPPPTSIFHSPPISDVQGHIDENEASVIYSFQNLRGLTTTYSIQIRRSTLRFVESYESPKEKGKPSVNKSDETGHCTEFKN